MYKLKMQQEIETCVQSTCFVAQIKKEKNALCLWKIMDMFLGQNYQKEYVDAFPRFITDSKILGEYLSQPRFRSEVWGTQKGVEVRVYDVVQAID